MGCGASKLDGIAEALPMMQSYGREEDQLTGNLGASEPIQVASVPDPATCMYISPSVIINDSASPGSVCIRTHASLSSDEDESDLDSSYEFPSILSIEELEGNVSRTTALAALSGEKTRTDEEDVEKRVEAVDGVLSIENSRESSTCALGMLLEAGVFQDHHMGTGSVITEQRLDAGLLQSSRVGSVAVISKSEPIRLEVIDLDGSCSCVLRPSLTIMGQEEPDLSEVLLLENTNEKHGDQSDQDEEPPHPPQPANLAAPAVPDNVQENSDQESASPLKQHSKQQELQLHDAIDTHKILSEPRKAKLPPLTTVPPIFVEIPANAFGKPALSVAFKQDLVEVELPAVSEAEKFEGFSARSTNLAALDSANADNHNTSKSSPLTEQCETPTPATNSPPYSEWRSPHRNAPDLDIEHIVLLESQELDMSPDRPLLLPLLDCQDIHMDKQDLISPSLRLT